MRPGDMASVLDELECTWRSLVLMFAMLDPNAALPRVTHGATSRDGDSPSAERELARMLANLARGLARATPAAEVRLDLRDDTEECHGYFPADLPPLTPANHREELVSPARLAIPIVAQDTVVGCVDMTSAEGSEGFQTYHKKLAKSVAAFLGLMIDRDQLLQSRRHFAAHVKDQSKLDHMTYRAWQLTEERSAGPSGVCHGMVKTVAYGIPSSAACIALWHNDGTPLHSCELGTDTAALERLGDTLEREKGKVLQAGSTYHGAFRRQHASPDGGPSERDSMAPLTSIMIVPFSRLTSAHGLLALGRTKQDAEFTTPEKQALSMISAFLTDRCLAHLD